MPSTPQITLFLALGIISSIVLFVVVKSVYEGVDFRSFLLAAVLMILVNGIDFLDLNPFIQWVVIAVVDFAILKKVIDCTVYFGAMAIGVWIGVHILFLQYLAGPILQAVTPGGS